MRSLSPNFAERMTDVEPDDITMQNVGECIARVHRDTYFVKTVLPRPVATDHTQYIEAKMQAMNQADNQEGETGDRISEQVRSQV